MADLFRKLNTLVKAKVSDVLTDLTSGMPRIPGASRSLNRDVHALRERINQAIEYEDTLQAKIKSLQEEIAQLDQQADDAVKQGNEALARHLVEQMQRTQQRLQMAESDLRAHQLVAQELIQKVNLLEATAADVRRDDTQSAETAASAGRLSNIVSEAREKISSVGQKVTTAMEKPRPAASEEDVQPESGVTVDDDLEARRARLSKR